MFGLHRQPKRLKVLVLGHSAVGKTALIVRFITRRFIGEYDSSERAYKYTTSIDNEIVKFEIFDSTGLLENETFTSALETNIRWAEAFVLVYSVTDICSFEEVNRLKFLINQIKRRKKICKDDFMDFPVILVANKVDQIFYRMVTTKEGEQRSQDIGCSCFHEISVSENPDEVQVVFRDICRFWRFLSQYPKLKRSKSDGIRLSMALHSDVDPNQIISRLHQICHDCPDEKRRSIMSFGRSRSTLHEDEEETIDDFNVDAATSHDVPFRSRAKTDGNLIMLKKKLWKLPTLSPPELEPQPVYQVKSRRNSISMRGHLSF